MGFFQGRKAVIATKHKKDVVIAPILENELGLICVTSDALDTDQLGTFSGEVERSDDLLETLRKKCQMAIDASGISVAIANEGSFGTHPAVYFAHADDEIIMLMDKENGIEIIERELSLETNFDGINIKSVEELIEELIENYHIIKNVDHSAYLETDMRAMHNPSRMKVIARVTEKLIDKIKSLCPNCRTPGFGVAEAQKGLPCEMCGLPTRSTLKHIYCCCKCNFQMEKKYPFEKRIEDAQYCAFCNP